MVSVDWMSNIYKDLLVAFSILFSRDKYNLHSNRIYSKLSYLFCITYTKCICLNDHNGNFDHEAAILVLKLFLQHVNLKTW